MNLTDISIKNPVLAWMLMAGTVLFGALAAMRIGVSQYPDVDYPNVSVSASWPGAGPSAVERELVEPIEQALAQVEGVQQISSQARQGSARITVSFDMSRNIDLALQDVQAKVAQAQRQLPRDVPAATVSKSNPDDTPIVTVGVTGPFARQLLADVARYQVQERLQTVPGVGQIQLSGYLDRNVRLWVDESRMNERGVAITDVLNAVRREHVELPGGQLEAGGRQLSVRLLGEALDLDALRAIVVRRGESGAPVYLKDVALVEDGFEDVASVARLDGVPLQALGVLKQRGSNAVAVARAVREKVAEVQKSLPEGMQVEVLFDTTKFIEESVHEIEVELALAVALTALVCWLFLGSLSGTVNVLLAIPMSLLGTVAIIYFWGFTLNTFTLLGLSLSVGLVVDDAVMVMENIYRHAEMGKERVRAASEGTREITFAALAATLAVVAIFLPVVFMQGVIGRFFYQFGVTLSAAVMISYLEAITLAPARCAQLLRAGAQHARGGLGALVDRGFARLERAYGRALGVGLRRPLPVLAVAALVFAAAAFAATRLPSEFVPSQDQSRLQVRLQADVGTTMAAAAPLLERAERVVSNHPEVEHTLTTLNNSGGSMTLMLVPPDQRARSAQQLAQALRRELGQIAGLRASIQDPSQQGFGSQRGHPVDVSVRGPDWETLVKEAQGFKQKLEEGGLVTDVNTDYQVGLPELQVEPDRRRASELGVSVTDLATTVSALVGGNVLGKFSTGGRRVDIRARLLASQRARPEDVGRLRVRAADGTLVPLSTLVRQEERPVMQSINRVDRERAIAVYGNVAPGRGQAEVLAAVEALGRDLPAGYRVVLGGQSSQLSETTSGLAFALLVGVAVAYMILASQFNSFLHPVTVLTILPLAIAGAVFGLGVAGKSLNLFSMIGVLLLMGIVKKNSILLVDYANQVRREDGLGAGEAMHRAGPRRLRPILMTTVATMMSAVPAALGLGPGAETRGPMAAAVLGGLTLSTLLSLLVVPAFYVVADRVKTSLGRRLGRRPEPEAPAAPPPPEAAPQTPGPGA
ncbi:MAG TPA: efflux RND transporter permease subunit [Polyangiaceae bacterium]|nr:efflux RND transporter permease subunit [Polyangiaceae bacterium]